ncbi:MATE family efflux transporter [Tannockella kyphosi]|uniref:MATE family efflux transporter n=1 Tax=Tannockella kyphosi TaxID=2899121 RepID=UPI002011B33C|nr:MATE family efflux transporter [Tannockella kyphosi]
MKQNNMATQPVFPLLLKMSLPPMLSMLIQSLYNIVDSMYVAYLGEDALTAISLAYPLQNLSLALAVGLGIGVNALIARNLGANDHERVNVIASNGLVMTLCHSLLFVVIGLFVTAPFFQLFTDSASVYQGAIVYGRIVLICAIGQHMHLFVEKMFQATGNMIIPMLLQLVGACINLILDPILIFGYFGMPALGIMGAAIATVTGQICTALLAIYLLHKKQKNIHFNRTYIKIENIKLIYSITIPSSIMLALPSLLISILNALLATFSQTAVAFFGIYYKLQTFIYMPSSGIIQGMRPLVAYNYGAKEYERVHKIIHTAVACIGSVLCLGTCLFLFFPTFILSMFNANQAMYDIGINGLRILSIGFICSTLGFGLSGVFEALGKGIYSMIVSFCRQFFITIVIAFVGSYFFGVTAIWVAFIVAEICGSIVAFAFYKHLHLK